MIYLLLLVLTFQQVVIRGFILSGFPRMNQFSNTKSSLSDGHQHSGKSEDWLENAAKLRREAEELENKLRESRSKKRDDQGEISRQVSRSAKYMTIADSTWTLSYRFSNRPKKENEPVDVNVFTGKLTLHFRPDGFTSILAHQPGKSPRLHFVKAWGWDVEQSNGDGKEYLLFSTDANFPGSDSNKPLRFYWQALQQRDYEQAITLQKGTVTIKQDIVESSSRRFWGFLSPRGILAQFVYVGDFAARPVTND